MVSAVGTLVAGEVSFRHYVFLSLVVTLSSFSYAWWTKKQFYAIAMHLATNKLNMVVLGNLAFLSVVILGKSLKRLFLGTLTRDEIEDLVQNSKYTITETMLALTIFREELNLRMVVLFTTLLFMKIFHWLAAMRVESLARTQNISKWQHARLMALMGFLAIIDWGFVIGIAINLLQTRTASVLLLFGLEFMILSVVLVSTFCKYILLVLDARWEARGQHWPNKNAWMFYLEFTADLVRLFLFLIFFCVICTYYGLPLHLIRELGITFYKLRERVIKFLHFRRITRNMNERFPDATQEELNQGDKTCIVCREDMEVGQTKKLPCGHMFHFTCLRTWLERSQSCPTCRAPIPVDAPPPPAQPNNAHANVGVAAAAAVPGAAAPPMPAAGAPVVPMAAQQQQPNNGLPPLPPGILAGLDAEEIRLVHEAHARITAINTAAGVPAAPPAASSPLHPMFGSSPQPPFGNQLQYPQHSPAPAHALSSPTPFGYPPPSFHGMHAGMPPPGAFMFPPPPPPPAHLFGGALPPLMHMMPPFAPSAMVHPPPSLATFPSDPLYGAYLAHHSMLLQHHQEYLESSLAQVRLLVAQQHEMTRKFAALKDSPATVTSPQERAESAPSSRSLSDFHLVDAIEGKEDGGRADSAEATLTHRRPHTTTEAQ